jgi:hypothetical protein
MSTVTLKNGSEEVQPLVTATMLSLRSLVQDKPIVFYELVMKCRDRNHRFFGSSGQTLTDLGLVEADGGIHESIRNIVLSATEGEGLEMTLGSPIKA